MTKIEDKITLLAKWDDFSQELIENIEYPETVMHQVQLLLVV